MQRFHSGRFAIRWSTVALLSALGCKPEPAPLAPTAPPEVTISQPIEREISDEVGFIGHSEAIKKVEIRARVSGFIDRVAFEDGQMVKQGDLLFQIDPRPFDAEVAKDQAALAVAKARAKRAAADLVRAEKLISGKTITQEDYDRIVADKAESAASVEQVEASLASAKLNLEFSTVTAPISGRMGRAEITKGNLVESTSGSATLLTTIVPVDPIYAYFDVEEPILLRYSRGVSDQGRPMAPVEMQLADETGFPHQGRIDFVDNRVDPATGTVKVRGVFPNAQGTILPGMFVRVRIRSAKKRPALLVSDRALGMDQGRKYLLLVGTNGKAEYREVETGALVDGLRVIEKGLRGGEWVIVNGLQRARPGRAVEAEKTAMPLPPASEETESEESPAQAAGPGAKTPSK